MISSEDSKKKYEFDVERRITTDFSPPMIAYENDKLSFEDLIGEDFELSKQEAKIDFKVHYDSDGRAIIDIKEGDKWVRGRKEFWN